MLSGIWNIVSAPKMLSCKVSEKRWFVMRDLKRRNANVLAIHDLRNAGLEVFTPMTQMIMTIGGRTQRRVVPVVQDLLFVHETKEILDMYVARYPNLQYRYQLGKRSNDPMSVSDMEMSRFILAVNSSDNPIFFNPGEITRSMYGKKIRIIGGLLDTFEGRLLSVKGMRSRRIIVELPHLIAAAVEVTPEFIEFI